MSMRSARRFASTFRAMQVVELLKAELPENLRSSVGRPKVWGGKGHYVKIEVSPEACWEVRDIWADVLDDSRIVRFQEPPEVFMVPNFSQTWLRSAKSFVLGKKGQIIPLDRRHDQFTGVLKTEVRERQRRMMATRRWTRRGSQRRA